MILTNAYIMHKHLYSSKGIKFFDDKSVQLKIAYLLLSSKSTSINRNSSKGGYEDTHVTQMCTTSLVLDSRTDISSS